MATLKTSFFGLTLGGVEPLAPRFEFNELLALFRAPLFRQQFKGYKGRRVPVRTHYFTWHGRPRALLTYLLRDAIVGLEGSVSNSVFMEALLRESMSPKIRDATINPFEAFKGKGTAASVYVGLPGLIDPLFALDVNNPKLWARVKAFYKEVRNPIFHAYEVGSDDPDPVWQCLELIWEVYQWLNSWHPVERLLPPEFFTLSPSTIRGLKELPHLDDHRVKQIIPAHDIPPSAADLFPYMPANTIALQVDEVLGLYVGSEEVLSLSLTSQDGAPVEVLISPDAAMRLLAFLALARQHRGWSLPDRLD